MRWPWTKKAEPSQTYVVLGEVEGDLVAAFATNDRDEAHRVLLAAEEAENAHEFDAAQLTLTNCVQSGDAFLTRLAETVG